MTDFISLEYFIEHLLGMKLTRAQKTIMLCLDKRVTVRMPRRTGKSFAAMCNMIYASVTQPNRRVVYITTSYHAAMQVKQKTLNMFINSLVGNFVKQCSHNEIQLRNGSKLIFIAASDSYIENYFRGTYNNYIIIDDAAYIDDELMKYIISPEYGFYRYYDKLMLISDENNANLKGAFAYSCLIHTPLVFTNVDAQILTDCGWDYIPSVKDIIKLSQQSVV